MYVCTRARMHRLWHREKAIDALFAFGGAISVLYSDFSWAFSFIRGCAAMSANWGAKELKLSHEQDMELWWFTSEACKGLKKF